jgi:hypothetical protein
MDIQGQGGADARFPANSDVWTVARSSITSASRAPVPCPAEPVWDPLDPARSDRMSLSADVT